MSKLSRLILSPSDELIGALLKDSRATLVYRTGDICVIESADRTLVESSQDSGRKWTRIFEEYHLANADNDKAQGVVVGAFCDLRSERYSND